MKKIYTILNRFECCGTTMISVIIRNKAACVMPEREYNKIIETERKTKKRKHTVGGKYARYSN